MNWDLIWTTIGLAVASFIILPFYIAMLIAYKKAISKVELEFLATAHHMEKQRSWTMLSNDCSKKEKLDEHGDGSKRVGWSRIGRG
jgi:hypothetical protein